MRHFCIASTKPWHRKIAQKMKFGNNFSWIFVSTLDELSSCANIHRPQYIFFLHWNTKVPANITQNFECVCFHMTDLPYGRGGSPLQNLIMAGKKETQVTAFRMTGKIDEGPIYAKLPLSLEGRAEDIYIRAGEICWKIVRMIVDQSLSPEPQIGESTIFKRRTPSESNLPTSGSLDNLHDFIRMLDAPTYPLAFIEYGEFFLEFSHSTLRADRIDARIIIRKSKSQHE